MKRIALPTWLAVVALAAPALAQMSASKPATAPTEFSTFGVKFDAPAGGIPVPLGQGIGDIAWYQFARPAPQMNAYISVGVVPRDAKRSLRDVAQAMADGATIVDGPAIGGEESLLLTASAFGASGVRRTSYLVAHENRVYTFDVLDTERAPVTSVLKGLLPTVRFAPPESPAKHLDLADDRVFFFDRASWKAPACLRVREKKANHVSLVIFDFTSNASVVGVELELIQSPRRGPFVAMRDEYSATLKQELQLSEPLQWRQRGAVHSSQFVATKRADAKAPPTRSRYCIVECGQNVLISIIFNVPEPPGSDAKPYLDLTDRMLDTIAIKPAPATRP